MNRRRLALALKAYFDESYDQLVSDVDEMPLQVDQAIADGVVEWLKTTLTHIGKRDKN